VAAKSLNYVIEQCALFSQWCYKLWEVIFLLLRKNKYFFIVILWTHDTSHVSNTNHNYDIQCVTGKVIMVLKFGALLPGQTQHKWPGWVRVYGDIGKRCGIPVHGWHQTKERTGKIHSNERLWKVSTCTCIWEIEYTITVCFLKLTYIPPHN
jgi:hypothetical protein